MLVYSDAIKEMFQRFETVWNAGATAIAGYIPEVRWPGVLERAKPPVDKFWVRISQRGVFEEQATLSDCVGIPGQRHYESSGFIYVQLFCPKSQDTAMQVGRKLAELARSAYRGKTTPGGVWFRDVTILSLDPEESWYRFNVRTEYEFGELG